MTKIKTYNQTAHKYAEKLRKRGYSVKFNWVDDGTQYTDITVRGAIFNGSQSIRIYK